jgi:hypothetical protein
MATARAAQTSKPRQSAEGLDKTAKIKVTVAGVILVLAILMIANSMGWISLFGSGASPVVDEPPLTAEQQEVRKVQIQQAKEEIEAGAKRPGTITAGE